MTTKSSTKPALRLRIYRIVEKAENGDWVSRLFDCGVLSLIVLTILAIVLESFSGLAVRYHEWFRAFEVFSVVVFTLEYLMRFWTAEYHYPGRDKWMARLLFFFSFMALVDLMSILPFYLPFLIPVDLRFLRILRLTRLFRLFKLNRYSRALHVIGKVAREKKEELLSTVFIMMFLIIISATLIYFVENTVQPDSFPNIIASFWWAVATLTTVGYGDIYPITGLGKILASLVAVTGIGLVALPTGIISSGFMEEIRQHHKCRCPKCGHEFKRD